MRASKILTILFFVATTQFAFAQSNSYQTLTDHFAGGDNVHNFKFSGFFCRTVLWMAGEWEFKDAISDVSNIRLINIPKGNLTRQELSIAGFRKVLQEDHYESLMNVKDHGDIVEFYIQQTGLPTEASAQAGNRKERYLVLVDEPAELTVIELKGHIDIEKLKSKDTELSYLGR